MENTAEFLDKTREHKFDKYDARGNFHWKQAMSKDIRVFNAYHQARYEWILKTLGSVEGKKVLDMGCGDGLLTYFLARAGADVTGVDNDEQGIMYARESIALMDKNKNLKYTFVNASVYELPLQSDSFDVVVSCEVIEHVPEPVRMVAEAHRVLKKGGMLVVTTPHRLTEFPKDINHVHEYFPTELQKILEEYLGNVSIKQTHHMLWRSLYGYSSRLFGNRPIGKWFLNTLVLVFGWNPFMIDYEKPTKFDTFSSICAWGHKK